MASVVRIRIIPHGIELNCLGPARLIDLIDDLAAGGLPLSCRGGTCATCRVRVERGAELLEPASARERETLHSAGAASDERLGCQLSVCADASGELQLSSTGAAAGS
jgi:ferredoxin